MTTVNASLLTTLGPQPVLGVSMGQVSLLRLDQLDALAPGNKRFKLRPVLLRAREAGVRRLVSFGGAWSNHLHALAAVGAEQGLETVGLVRGNAGEADTAMLAEARAWGMVVERVGRSEYRRRHEPGYLAAVQKRYQPCLVVPEGGASADGVNGCRAIATLIAASGYSGRRVVLPVGTGTTLAGVAAGLPAGNEVIGVSALKGAGDLEDRVRAALAGPASAAEDRAGAQWQILPHEHCGGFARVSPALQAFMLAFEAVHPVALDPVYTGKMMLAIHRRLARAEWPADEPLLAIHTGGLQGRRGYAWLPPA